jgi:CubicO group peptidase (beta-lactamase class C family)
MGYQIIVTAISLSLISPALANCQPELAFLPPNLTADSLKSTFDGIQATIDGLASKGFFNKTSFSLQISSSSQDLFSLFRAADTPAVTGTKTVDGSSVYRVASNTKLFTSLGILRQEAEGKLSLDHPVSRYVSGLPKSGAINWSKITIRNLLSHLGGIPDSCE